MKNVFALLLALVMLCACAAADDIGLVEFEPTISNAGFPAKDAGDFYYNSGPEVKALMALLMLLDYSNEADNFDINDFDVFNDTYVGVDAEGSVYYAYFNNEVKHESVFIMFHPVLGVAAYHVVPTTEYTTYVEFMLGDMCKDYERIGSKDMMTAVQALASLAD